MSFNRKIKRIRHFFEYCGILFFFHLVRLLPRQFIVALAVVAGNAMFLIPPFKKLLMANVQVAFPEKALSDVREIARKSIISLIQSLLDFFWYIDRPDKIERDVVFPDESWKITRLHKEKGEGLIWVTPHIGNWELAGLKFKYSAQIPFAVVVRKNPNPFLNRLVNAGRSSEGNMVIQAKGSVKSMLKAIKKGYFLATLIDQNTRVRDGGLFVDFFGLPVPTSRAPAFFARKMKTPLYVAGCVRKQGKYELFTEALPQPLDHYKTEEELTQALMAMTEKVVRQYPEQYLWFYKRFQYIPKDAPDEIRQKYPFYSFVAKERFYSNSAPKGT